MKKNSVHVHKKEILDHYQYLYDVYGFKVSFWLDNFGYRNEGFCLGLEKGEIRIMFVKETEARQVEVLIGNQMAPFENPDSRGQRLGIQSWFRVVSLIEYFTGEKLYSKTEYETLDQVEFTIQLSQKIKKHFLLILEKFKDKNNINAWIGEYYLFVVANKT